MSALARHRAYVPMTRSAYARLRFTNVWRMRWHRHSAAFVGGVATVTAFALVAAIASMIGSAL